MMLRLHVARLAGLGALLILLGCTAPRPSAPVPARASRGTTTIYLVRHAERAPGQGDVSISEAGRLRAYALRDTLAARGIEAIIVSQFRRTAETAAPLAEARNVALSARPLNLFGITASADSLAKVLATEFAGRTILVVGHSNTIPVMVAALTGTPHADLNDGDFDGLYRVQIGPGGSVTSTRIRYGADDGVADPPEPPR